MISKFWLIFLIVLDVALWMAAVIWPAWRQDVAPMNLVVGVWPGSETIETVCDSGEVPVNEVNLIEMLSSPAAIRAFENRVTDAAVLTLDEVLRLQQEGTDVSIILVCDFSKGADVVLGKPGINTLEDLRGKKIGVSSRSTGMYLLRRSLEKTKLTPEDLVVIPTTVADSETAFEDGELDAVVTCEPWCTRLIENGAVKLADSQAISQDIARVLVVRTSEVSKFRSNLQMLVDAHFRALATFRKLTADDALLQGCAKREDVSPEDLLHMFTKIEQPDLAANRALLDPEKGTLKVTAERLAAYFYEHGMLKKPVDCSHLVDPSFVRNSP